MARGTLARADELLAPWGLQGPDARCVFMLYLLAIGSRYAADDQRGAGARLGDLDSWLFVSSTTCSPRANRRWRLPRRRKGASRGAARPPP